MKKSHHTEPTAFRILLSIFACGITMVASAQTQTRTIRVVPYNIMDDISCFSTPLCGLIAPVNGTGGTFTTSCSGSVTNVNGNYTNGGWQDTGQTGILSGGNGCGTVANMTDVAIPSARANRYHRMRVVLP